ncbi:unnamed protein product, partial [marine sediment metagenome]
MKMLTETFYVTGGFDDAHQAADGYFESHPGFVRVRSNPVGESRYSGGFRFPNITIPRGAVVQSAKLRLHVTYMDDVNCEMYGNNVDNAEDFSVDPQIISRPVTMAHAPFVKDDLGAMAWVEVSGLEAIIQEIVNRTGWTSGNAIVLLLMANSDVDRFCQFWSYENSPTDAAQLEITYITGVMYNLSIQVNDVLGGYTSPEVG